MVQIKWTLYPIDIVHTLTASFQVQVDRVTDGWLAVPGDTGKNRLLLIKQFIFIALLRDEQSNGEFFWGGLLKIKGAFLKFLLHSYALLKVHVNAHFKISRFQTLFRFPLRINICS